MNFKFTKENLNREIRTEQSSRAERKQGSDLDAHVCLQVNRSLLGFLTASDPAVCNPQNYRAETTRLSSYGRSESISASVCVCFSTFFSEPRSRQCSLSHSVAEQLSPHFQRLALFIQLTDKSQPS